MAPTHDPTPDPADPADGVDAVDLTDVERYARAAAWAAGLVIDDAWWPAVSRHLDGLLQRAASLEGLSVPHDPAPVFTP